MMVRYSRPLQLRHARHLSRWSHISPDNPAELTSRIRFQMYLLLESTLRRFRWHIHTVTLHIKLPTVKDASQARLFVPAKKQGRAAMRTMLIHESNPVIGIAKRHQIFTQQPHSYRRAVRAGKLVC